MWPQGGKWEFAASRSCFPLFFDLDEGGVDIMKRLVLAILVVLSLAVGVNAQTFRGAINGTVTDPSGAVVPNASVKATESATGIDHTATTTVEVSAAALTLDTTTPTQTLTINEMVVDAIPIAGRDFTQLIGVQPGA